MIHNHTPQSPSSPSRYTGRQEKSRGQKMFRKWTRRKAQFTTWVPDHETYSSRPDPSNVVPPAEVASQLSMVGTHYSWIYPVLPRGPISGHSHSFLRSSAYYWLDGAAPALKYLERATESIQCFTVHISVCSLPLFYGWQDQFWLVSYKHKWWAISRPEHYIAGQDAPTFSFPLLGKPQGFQWASPSAWVSRNMEPSSQKLHAMWVVTATKIWGGVIIAKKNLS